MYGQSKAAGDIAAALTPKHYILRTSWVIGEGANFVRTMMSLAEKNISPSVVDDQIRRLTFTKELVRAVDHLVSNNCDYGTYNLTNSGESASWADITKLIFKTINSSCTVTGITRTAHATKEKLASPRDHSTAWCHSVKSKQQALVLTTGKPNLPSTFQNNKKQPTPSANGVLCYNKRVILT